MEGKEVNLDQIALDVETVRQTLEKLEGGTSEGTEEVERAIESAEDVTAEKFDTDDEDLERNEAESREFEEEIERRKESSEADLGKTSDASAEFKTQEAIKEFGKVKAAALEGIEYLEQQRKRALDAREKTESKRKELENLVRKSKERR